MEINERLYEAGLLAQFEAALDEEDLETMAQLLEKVGLRSSQVEAIAQGSIFRRYLDRCRKDLDAMSLQDLAKVYVARFDGRQPDMSIGRANLVELIMGDIRLNGS